jgi:hypothetical protein
MWASALLLLICVGITGSTSLIALIGAARGNHHLFRRAALGAVMTGAAYGLLLIGVAAVAPEKKLPRGAEKYICELDCHLAYSVVDVERTGDSLRVKINVRFDEKTTSPRRPDDTRLLPGGRAVRVRDSEGHYYLPVSLGDLGRTLLPGESYQTTLIFDVDPAARGLVLYISDADFTKMVLVGSDNAPFRKPVGFQL